MLQQVIITGAKASKGEMEGRPYDSTKIYVETRMDPTKGTMAGKATEEYNWGLSDNFDTIKDLKFPLQANVDFEQVTSGTRSKTIVMDVQILPTSTSSPTTKSN